MSQPGGRKGKNNKTSDTGDQKEKKNKKEKEPSEPPKDAKKEEDKETSNADITSSAGDEEAPPPKPQSAGASIRDAAQRVLLLSQKGEWGPVDQTLKSMEKAITNAGEDANTIPLLGVADPVGIQFYNIFLNTCMLSMFTALKLEQTNPCRRAATCKRKKVNQLFIEQT